jgi:flagellar motor switch protein FliG
MEFEKHVKVRQEKFGAVVFETLREKVFVTNSTGSQILRSLNNNELADVVDELAKIYNCNPEMIKDDVEEFITQLKDNGIMKKEAAA